MSQVTSLSVANGGGSAVRAALNNELGALFSANSGATAPTATVGGMLWLDTGVSPAVLRVRNNANTAWIALGPETVAATTVRGNSGGSAAAIADITMTTLATMLGFAQVASAAGYVKLPGGIILQWTSGVTAGGTGISVTWPLTFPTAIWRVVVAANSAASVTATFQSQTTSGALLQAWTSSTGAALNGAALNVFAIGN